MSLVIALDALQHATYDEAADLVNVVKGGVGFDRGPKAGHKYWRRVRALVGGKLGWVYYYNTPADKARFAADRERKRKRDNARAAARRAEGKATKEFEATHAAADGPEEDRVRLRSQFLADHPELRAKRAAWEDLNTEYIQGLFGMTSPPEVYGSDAVRALYGAAIEAHYGPDGEPEDLHGSPIHWLRAAEMAVKLIPADVWRACDGQLTKIDVVLGSEDSKLSENQKYAGYAERGSGRICIGADRIRLGGSPGPRALDGGLIGVHVMVHEMAHQIHNRMMATGGPLLPGGPNWAEWEAFFDQHMGESAKRADRETGITKYAHKNAKEAFAESLSAALMYPHTMATQCPRAYDLMRRILGTANLRPRVTDPAEVRRLREAADSATDATAKSALLAQLDRAAGLDSMSPSDERLEWWRGQEASPIGKLIVASRDTAPNYHATSLTFADPPDEDAAGKQGSLFDRFYEMNHGGRTVYLRVGPDGGHQGGDWDPADSATSAAKLVLRPEQVKEAYDEEGRPLDRQLVYWHLHQDLYSDPNEVVGEATIGEGKTAKKVAVTVADVFAHGLSRGGSAGRDSGTETEQAVRRLLEANGIDKWMRTLTAESYRVENADGSMAWRPATGGRGGGTASLENFEKWAEYQTKKGLPADPAQFARERELYLAARKMAPQEMSAHEYRQRSGTFNYDKIGLAGQAELDELARLGSGQTERLPDGTLVLSLEQEGRRRELLERLKKVQPGLETRQTRGPKGRFQKARIVVDADGKPKMQRKRWINDNPDGTQSVFFTSRGPDGRQYLEDPMWAALLTPNGEPIRSAAHLEQLCRDAAAEKRRTWVSVKTDRPRVRKGKRWEMAPAGDTAHYLHFEVEFDGHGQPKVLGETWKRHTGKDAPRIDQLLEDDPVFRKLRADARPVLPGEQIRLRPETQRTGTPRMGDRVILAVKGAELPGKGAQDRDVVAWLTRVIPGKAAGVVPDPPGWDRMPEGVENLKPPGPAGELARRLVTLKRSGVTLSEKALRDEGLLPPWYTGSTRQREWFEAHFVPAYLAWIATKDAETDKEYPVQYIFAGETGGGGGRKVFRRYGDITDDVRWPEATSVPEPLQTQLLMYMHQTVDPRTGATVAREARLVLPADGSVSPLVAEGLPGVEVEWDDPKKKTRALAIRASLESFGALRSALSGGLSITSEINRAAVDRVAMLREAADASADAEHTIELGQITPEWLRTNWGADLNVRLPNGAAFVIGDHQQRLLQKLLDNNGRVLGAHYMGTGKTVSAIVAAQMMMARPDPTDSERKHPDNPKRVLIVAPLNTVEQWRVAAGDFDGGALTVGSGSNDLSIDEFLALSEEGKGDMVVVGPEYFTLHADKLKAAGFDGLIIDEVHQGVKNDKAERNRKVREWNADMKMMMLLTGTPMTTGPADIVEYVRLLSQGKTWGDMTTERFVEEFLEASEVSTALGSDKKGPKIQVKAAKRGELATTLRQWMDIALPKDVRGKTLPAVRIEENQHAFMTGIQAQLYNLYMATAGSDVSEDALADEERARLSPDARRAVAAAKAVVNCPAYKPGSTEAEVTFETETPNKAGKMVRAKVLFRTHDPDVLMSKELRKKAAGKWPLAQELQPAELMLYDMLFSQLFGGGYSLVAGTKITPEQLSAMRADGWPRTVPNPDRGPLGIRARGLARPWVEIMNERITAALDAGDNGTAQTLQAERDERMRYIDEALAWQRHVRQRLVETAGEDMPYDEKLNSFAEEAGITWEDATALMQVHPVPVVVEPVVTAMVNGRPLTIDSQATIEVNGEQYPRFSWVSDKKGSLHTLYRPQDWDEASNAPRSRGGFEAVHVGELVSLSGKALKGIGLEPPKRPTGLTKEQRADWDARNADWAAPALKYMGGEPDDQGNVPLTRLDTGEVLYAPASEVSAQVRSVFDVGMREERELADVVMTMGNAKADELKAHLQRFHADSGPGRDGERQVVLFGNGILDACRTMEAQLRMMGFRDANECIPGSPHYDPQDPALGPQGQSPNGKYFVTYIGSTATGDRELNIAIFQKVKDKLGRDSKTSLFVHKTTQPRSLSQVVDSAGNRVSVNWAVYPGDTEPCAVRPSQWTADQRATIQAQFGIKAPESFVEIEQPDGTVQQLAFYGTPESARILRALVAAENPVKLPPERAAAVRAEIAKLKAQYEALARAGASTEAPLTAHQVATFNNCEAIICSDAAQVGMNLGNSVEMVMYDSLGSPMAEWQRITRCARMLPPAVEAALIGTPIREPLRVRERDETGQPVVGADGKHVWVEKLDDNGEPVMVPVYDEHGRPKYQGSGAFTRLREMEAELFRAGPRSPQAGSITGLRLAPQFPNSGRDMGTETFEAALGRIQLGAQDQAEHPDTPRDEAIAWGAIAAKSAYAATLGTTAARAMFDELAATTTPGATGPLIEYPAGGIKYQDPEVGTYDEVQSLEVTERLRAAIDQLPEADQAAIHQAGFTGGAGGADSHDPVAVYLAIRAGEVLDWIVANRADVAAEMRSSDAGRVVTDADVTNRLIDMLSPEDRAVLKTKKYLVNVRKLGAAAHVGQVVTNAYTDPTTGETEVEKVHTGYEQELPVRTERGTRALGRARMITFEQILTDVQGKVTFTPPDFIAETDAGQLANASRTNVEKALLAFVLGGFRA